MSDAMTITEVASPKDFPNGAVVGFRAKSVDEIRKWAERRQASQVWYYRHQIGQSYTAVVIAGAA